MILSSQRVVNESIKRSGGGVSEHWLILARNSQKSIKRSGGGVSELYRVVRRR